MNPLSILIIEDDLLTATDIKETLVEAGYHVTVIHKDFDNIFNVFNKTSVDLAIVDITLSESIDGITIVHKILHSKQIPIIYITARSELSIFNLAKETNPAAYLIKPFRNWEIPLQIELAIHNFYSNRSNKPLPETIDYFLLPIGRTYLRVNTNEVVYIGAEGSYSEFFLTEEGYERIKYERRIILSVNLGQIKTRLPEEFYQLSRSIIINLHYVDKIEYDLVFLRQYRLSIPEGRRKLLIDKLNLIGSRKN